VFGTPGVPGPYQDLAQSRVGANEAERRAVAAALAGKALAGSAEAKKEADEKKLPTFKDWFHGRFWLEHVKAQDNKPSEVESKQSIMKIHLEPEFGSKRLDEIDVGAINRFRAKLLGKELSKKRINNILAVLSKALRYADDVGLIKAPRKIGNSRGGEAGRTGDLRRRLLGW